MKNKALKLARGLLPRSLHSSLRLWALVDWPDEEPKVIRSFNADAVVVLAPHPDDEVIGPGGVIRRHVLAGATVTPVVLTDGRWGGPNSDGTLVERRKEESRRAAQIMGTAQPIFLDQPDARLRETPAVSQRVAEIIRQNKARFVYLPALTDLHTDHWSTNRLLHAALDLLTPVQLKMLRIRGYEVWSPLLANRVADVTETIETKRQAIDAFASQIATHDYTGAVLGLNHYRSLLSQHGKGYAEAFMEFSVAEYRRAFAAASLRHVPATPVAPAAIDHLPPDLEEEAGLSFH